MKALATKNDSWSMPINKLMVHVDEKWVQYGRQNISDSYMLRVQYDQMFIIQNNKIVERTSGKTKIFFKDNILIIVYYDFNNKMRKFRFQLIASDLNECIQKLNKNFPVIHHKQLPNFVPLKYKDLGDTLKDSMANIISNDNNLGIPSNYEDFIKVCLLDPSFPHFVAETQNVLNNISAI